MKKILSVFLFTILAVSVTHAEGLVYTSGTGGPYKPTFTFSNTLRFNAKSNDVVELQKTLISKGYLKAGATGYFGKLTFAAVKAFQKDNKLKDDGIVGKVTKNLLIQEINAPISNGTPQIDVSDAINPQTNAVPCTASTPASIKVLSPNGGESYINNQGVTVKWTSCNIPANTQLIVELMSNNDGIMNVFVQNTGTHTFQLSANALMNPPVTTAQPVVYGQYFKVHVGTPPTIFPSYHDWSDGLFTITSPVSLTN
jgi:peptidoglycan hydrolase-like protein with peptidoglycan-binding domain